MEMWAQICNIYTKDLFEAICNNKKDVLYLIRNRNEKEDQNENISGRRAFQFGRKAS